MVLWIPCTVWEMVYNFKQPPDFFVGKYIRAEIRSHLYIFFCRIDICCAAAFVYKNGKIMDEIHAHILCFQGFSRVFCHKFFHRCFGQHFRHRYKGLSIKKTLQLLNHEDGSPPILTPCAAFVFYIFIKVILIRTMEPIHFFFIFHKLPPMLCGVMR